MKKLITIRPFKNSVINRSITVAALFFLIFEVCIAQNPAQKPLPVRDGFVLDGVDGKITSENSRWFFTVFEPLTDGKGALNTQTAIAILPSSMLEKLASIVSAKNASFRIWGKLTSYGTENFVYLSYFLPITEANEPPQAKDNSDSNEAKIIPDDVLLLLKPKRVISLAELKKPIGTESDGILSDRTGFVRRTKDGVYFGFDGMGRNIDSLQLPLLECEELDSMENQQKASARPVRFNISAIVTRYQGKRYLLLQRATRVYSCGNFTR
ncbi:MAG: hypothetical protein WC496_00085 [Phycisphaerae bacterium]